MSQSGNSDVNEPNLLFILFLLPLLHDQERLHFRSVETARGRTQMGHALFRRVLERAHVTSDIRDAIRFLFAQLIVNLGLKERLDGLLPPGRTKRGHRLRTVCLQRWCDLNDGGGRLFLFTRSVLLKVESFTLQHGFVALRLRRRLMCVSALSIVTHFS